MLLADLFPVCLHSKLQYTAQASLPGGGSTHSGLDPPSVNPLTKQHPTDIHAAGRSGGGSSSTKVLQSLVPRVCVKLNAFSWLFTIPPVLCGGWGIDKAAW